MCAGVLILALVEHAPAISLLGMTLVMAGSLSWSSVFWSLPTSFLSGAAAAASIAFINATGQLGGYLGPDVVGRVRAANHNNIDVVLYVLAIGLLLGILITLLLPLSKRPAPSV